MFRRLALPLPLCLCLLAGGCAVKSEVKATEKEKEAAKSAAAERAADPKALMPVWYRKSLKTTYSISSQTTKEGFKETTTESAEPEVEAPMMRNSLYLGLFFLPIIVVV